MKRSAISDILAAAGTLLMVGGDLVFLLSYRGWILPYSTAASAGGVYAILAGLVLHVIYELLELPANKLKLSFRHEFDERVLWITGRASYSALQMIGFIWAVVLVIQVYFSISLTIDLTFFVIILCAAVLFSYLYYYERKYRGGRK